MTEKPFNDEDNRRYRYRATASVSRPVVRRTDTGQRNARESAQDTRGKKGNTALRASTKRRVTLPAREDIKPLSWAERRERFYATQEERPTRGRLVQRTFAQTGRPAPVGPIRGSRPPRSQYSRPSVPERGGQRRGRWGFLRRFLGLLVVLIMVTGGIIFALVSPNFQVQQVHINGAQNQALAQMIQHMGIQGQNIFLLNQSALTTRLDGLPMVNSANLGIQLPNNVVVNIQERVPVLLWQSGQKTLGVAQDGTILAPASELSGTSYLNVIIDKRTDVGASQVQPGSRLHAANIAFAEQVFQQLPKIQGIAPFALQYVDQIAVGARSVPANQAGYGSYVVVSAAGWKAYLGDAQNSNPLANRLLELQQILLMAQQAHLALETIDLRFGLRPTYTLKS